MVEPETQQALLTSYVAERDLDLLLAEELQCSEPFAGWLQKLLMVDGPQRRAVIKEVSLDGLPTVQHSVSREEGLGETDLEALWDATWTDEAGRQSGRLLLLFENNVDAAFQPDQAGRYHKEGALRVTKGHATQYLTILFAPQEYLSASAAQKEFDMVLAYEALVDHIEKRIPDQRTPPEVNRRLRFNLALLRQGIDKSRRGYQAIISPDTTRFWNACYEIAKVEAPALCMSQPKPKPAYSSFIHFPKAVSKGLNLCYKFEKGRVDLEIKRGTHLQDEIEKALGPILPPSTALRPLAARPGKPSSLAVSMPVPSIPFQSQPITEILERISEGFRAALVLQSWAREHRQVLEPFLKRLSGRSS